LGPFSDFAPSKRPTVRLISKKGHPSGIYGIDEDVTMEKQRRRNFLPEEGPYLPGSLPVQTGLPPLQRSQIIFGDDGIKTLKLGGVRFEQMQKIQHHSKKLNPKSHVTSIHLG
jgi:hypothetical protein